MLRWNNWLLKVTWLVLTNQTALFQQSYATLKFVNDIGSLSLIYLISFYFFTAFNLPVNGHSRFSLVKDKLDEQCDQFKVTKCLWQLPKNDSIRDMKDFDTFTKIA